MTVGIGNEVVSDDEEGLLQDVTVIGAGSELLPLQSGDLALSAGPGEDGKFASVRFSRDGTVRVNERVIANDSELVTGLHGVMRAMLRVFGYDVPELGAVYRKQPRVPLCVFCGGEVDQGGPNCICQVQCVEDGESETTGFVRRRPGGFVYWHKLCPIEKVQGSG